MSPYAQTRRERHRDHMFGLGAAWWPPGLAHRRDPARQSPGVGERTAQEVLDLGVRAAQLVGGPAGQRVVDRRVESQQDALALCHRVARRRVYW
jgi:hypothetical protein